MEKTFFMIKPDGVKRGLIGQVLERIERRGFVIEKLELRQADAAILRKHYDFLVDKPFFPEIEAYMTSGPLLIGVLSGNRVVSSWRMMMGVTNPKDALPGTIRGDFGQAQETMVAFKMWCTVQILSTLQDVKLISGLQVKSKSSS